MARTKALSLLQAASTKADLKEIYGIVIENIQRDTLSNALKSQNYSGSPAAGSVEYKRFANSQSKTYGTARTAGKGDAVKVPPITVNVDTHKEIVEEVSKFDLDTFGVAGIMSRRASNHIDTMASDLPYALRQHEELGYKHPKGGQAKFLEQPFSENEQKYIDMLKSIPDEALR